MNQQYLLFTLVFQICNLTFACTAFGMQPRPVQASDSVEAPPQNPVPGDYLTEDDSGSDSSYPTSPPIEPPIPEPEVPGTFEPAPIPSETASSREERCYLSAGTNYFDPQTILYDFGYQNLGKCLAKIYRAPVCSHLFAKSGDFPIVVDGFWKDRRVTSRQVVCERTPIAPRGTPRQPQILAKPFNRIFDF